MSAALALLGSIPHGCHPVHSSYGHTDEPEYTNTGIVAFGRLSLDSFLGRYKVEDALQRRRSKFRGLKRQGSAPVDRRLALAPRSDHGVSVGYER
jgi:hypothetical protein